jgi:hypothetical protein
MWGSSKHQASEAASTLGELTITDNMSVTSARDIRSELTTTGNMSVTSGQTRRHADNEDTQTVNSHVTALSSASKASAQSQHARSRIIVRAGRHCKVINQELLRKLDNISPPNRHRSESEVAKGLHRLESDVSNLEHTRSMAVHDGRRRDTGGGRNNDQQTDSSVGDKKSLPRGFSGDQAIRGEKNEEPLRYSSGTAEGSYNETSLSAASSVEVKSEGVGPTLKRDVIEPIVRRDVIEPIVRRDGIEPGRHATTIRRNISLVTVPGMHRNNVSTNVSSQSQHNTDGKEQSESDKTMQGHGEGAKAPSNDTPRIANTEIHTDSVDTHLSTQRANTMQEHGGSTMQEQSQGGAAASDESSGTAHTTPPTSVSAQDLAREGDIGARRSDQGQTPDQDDAQRSDAYQNDDARQSSHGGVSSDMNRTQHSSSNTQDTHDGVTRPHASSSREAMSQKQSHTKAESNSSSLSQSAKSSISLAKQRARMGRNAVVDKERSRKKT